MHETSTSIRKPDMADSPITFRAPPENAAAYKAAAEKAGLPLGRWINDRLTEALSKSVRKSLPEPRQPGRPKKLGTK
jgi:hypothetical protein